MKLFSELIEVKNALEEVNELEILQVKSRLASVYREMGRFDEAKHLINEAIYRLFELTDTKNSLFMANLLNTRGMIFKRMEKFEEAIKDYEEVVGIREGLLPEAHPEILSIKHNLCKNQNFRFLIFCIAELYYVMDDKQKAADYARDVMDAHETQRLGGENS